MFYKVKFKILVPNGCGSCPLSRFPRTAEERAAWLDRVAEQDEPPEPEDWPGPDDELTAEEVAELAELRQSAEADALATADAVARGLPGGQYVRPGRRGPGQAGSARPSPGESASRAGAFGAGMARGRCRLGSADRA